MFGQRRFSLRDAILLGVVGVVLVSLVVVGRNDYDGGIFVRRSGGRGRMQCGTQVRGIQQSLVLYSQSNNDFYPGYTADGQDDFAALAPAFGSWGSNALTDDDIGKIYALLLNGEFFTPEYMISPQDDAATQAKGPQFQPVIAPANYSYAMLDMNDADSNRRHEWRDTNNSQALVVADPSSDIRPMINVTYHSSAFAFKNSDSNYEGDIAWNDNHVTFESSALFAPGKLKIGDTPNAAALNPFKNKANDGTKLIW